MKRCAEKKLMILQFENMFKQNINNIVRVKRRQQHETVIYNHINLLVLIF